jgi:hypothetical protein
LVEGVGAGRLITVRPASARPGLVSAGMAGRCVPVERGFCFIPRFAFMDGTTYIVEIDGRPLPHLVRPASDRLPVTEVVAIHPTAAEVPRNLLRLYVVFSSPMSEGYAADHVRLTSGDGERLDHALFSLDQELWDGRHRRLTLLLDPARLKRGLVPHSQLSYPLVTGSTFRVTVAAGFCDARGAPLRAPAARSYRVVPDARRRVETSQWRLTAPGLGTLAPLALEFDRPLDHGLLARCLHLTGPGLRAVAGIADTGPEDRTWRWWPESMWRPGSYRLSVRAILEDLAGNSLRRVFDRDLDCRAEDPGPDGPAHIDFVIDEH